MLRNVEEVVCWEENVLLNTISSNSKVYEGYISDWNFVTRLRGLTTAEVTLQNMDLDWG